MKTAFITLAAALFVSCGLIEKATERNIEVGSFDITIPAYFENLEVDRPQLNDTRAATRAGSSLKGSYTVTKKELLGNQDVEIISIKKVTIETVSFSVKQNVGDVNVDNLELASAGVTSVKAAGVPLNDIGSATNAALKPFVEGVIKNILNNGEATVSIDVQLDQSLQGEKLDYQIKLEGVVVRVGLDL